LRKNYNKDQTRKEFIFSRSLPLPCFWVNKKAASATEAALGGDFFY